MTPLKPLLDEPGSDLDRVLLEAGLDEAPPKASLDRTLVALGVGSATAITAGAVGGAGASLGGAKGVFGAGVAKWIGGALIASAALGGGYWVTQREPRAAVAPQVVAPGGAEAGAVERGNGASRTAARTPEQASEPLRDAPKSSSEEKLETSKAAEAKVAEKAAEPKVAEAKVAEAKVAEAKASQPKAEPKGAAKSEPNAGQAKPDMTTGGGSLSDELRMLDTARKALLAGDNDACLANLAKYSSKFPKGQLTSEAQAMKASCSAKKSAASE